MQKFEIREEVKSLLPGHYSEEELTGLKLKLKKLNRSQLEILIIVLGQEIIKLEHQLTCPHISSLTTDEENNDCQTVKTKGSNSAQSSHKTTSITQRILHLIAVVSKVEKQRAEVDQQDLSLKSEDHFLAVHNQDSITDNKISHHKSQNSSLQASAGPDLQPRHYPMNSAMSVNEERLGLDSVSSHSMGVRTTAEPSLRKGFDGSLLFPRVCIFNRERTETDVEMVSQTKIELQARDKQDTAIIQTNEDVGMGNPQTFSNRTHFRSYNIHRHLKHNEGSAQNNKTKRILQCQTRHSRKHKACTSKEYGLAEQCTTNRLPEAFQKSVQVSETQTYSCSACSASFDSEQLLAKHLTAGHRYAQFSCKVCNKPFTYKHNLEIHQRNNHSRSLVLCSCCGKLVLQFRLDLHMKKVHEKPLYKCHICHKGFLKRECLEGHINRHSNTKPYICEFCGRKYVYSTSLSSHKRICLQANIPSHLQQLRPQGDRAASYICEICGTKFEGVSGLKDHHKAKHSSKLQHCSLCGKGFQWRPSYNRHIKKCKDRTELEREKCRQQGCQKPGSKQYICVCGKRYPYRQSYRRHQRNCSQKIGD